MAGLPRTGVVEVRSVVVAHDAVDAAEAEGRVARVPVAGEHEPISAVQLQDRLRAYARGNIVVPKLHGEGAGQVQGTAAQADSSRVAVAFAVQGQGRW